MDNICMKSGSVQKIMTFWLKLQDVTVPHKETIHRMINILQQCKLLGGKINIHYTLMRSWMTLVLHLNILVNISYTMHREPEFQNSQYKLPQNS
jgi:hypothetical protein